MTNSLHNIFDSIDKLSTENAFCISDKYYSYADLKTTTASIQRLISDNHLSENSNIGILTYNDIETYASVFAIMFSGHAFVPINPLHPEERNKSIISQAGIKILLSSRNDAESKTYASDQTALVHTGYNNIQDSKMVFNLPADEQNAYVLFTSGSTGVPKGVPLTIKNLNSFLDAFFSLGYKIDHNDRFIQMFDMTFDLSIMSYMAPLCIGACVYTVPFDGIKYVEVYNLLEKYELTFTLLVPSMLTSLRPYFSEINLPSMRYSLFCGEALWEDITLEWGRCLPNAEIHNVYGPTEATIFCTTYKVNKAGGNKNLNGILSIGKPMKQMEAIIADENLKPLPQKEKGELCMTGPQVTPGYWKNEEKNKEAFFTYEGKRYYRTGDLCVCDEEGDYDYIGRVDFQVKVQGFRVELSEIEHHAREFMKPHAVVAHAYTNSAGITFIVLFVENYKRSFDELTAYLREKLPPYMIPSKFFGTEAFPLNANGKVDRKALVQTVKIE